MSMTDRIFQVGTAGVGRTRLARAKSGALMVAAMSIALVAGGTVARADEDCKWYALTSAKQMQQNESKKCGLKGEGWSTDQAVHLTYCAGVAPEEWRKAVEDRKKQLETCG